MNGNAKNEFTTEFQTFCSILHENLLHNGKHHQIMTLDTERKLLNYLLDQENTECSEELSSWVQQLVFCVVTDESETKFELHVWDDKLYQKKVVSLENYFVTLSNLYLQHSSVSLESFQKKVKETYVLIPESVVKYFFDHFSDSGGSKKNKLLYARKREDKENKIVSCKVICYDYIKKKVMKRKVVTDKIDKSSGNVISSKSHEEMIDDNFVYCLQKSEKLFDISNGQSNELSSSNYTASEALEVKFLDKSVLAYFPPDEMKNHDHLVTFSNLIYKDQGISPEQSQTIQMEFVVPKEPLEKYSLDMNFNVDTTLQEDDHSSYIPKKKSKKPASSRQKRKSQKENSMLSASTQKLTIITDPVTKGATLRIDPNSENDTENFEQQSFSSLFAAATEEETVLESSASDVPQSVANHQYVVEDHEDDTGEQPTENIVEGKDIVTVQDVSEEEIGSPEKLEVEYVKVESILREENVTHQVVEEKIDDDMKVKLVKPAQKMEGLKSSPKKRVEQSVSPSLVTSSVRKSSRVIQTKDANKLETTEAVVNSDDGLHNDDDDDELSENNSFEDYLDEIENDRDTEEIINKEKDEFKVRRSLRKAIPNVNKVSMKDTSLLATGPTETAESEVEPNPTDLNSDTAMDEKVLKCKLCSKRFKSKSGLYYHEQGHRVSVTHHCESCGNTFPNKYCLRQHIRRIHLDLVIKREYACEYCGKTFKSWSGCDYHRTKEHMDRTTTCELCGKTYANIYSYRNHVADIHSGRKRKRKPRGPQKCKDCGKVFKSHSGLNYHRFTRHSGEKLICSVCGVSLSCKRTLQIHMDAHEGKRLSVTCTICGKAYASKNSLYSHMATHEQSVSVKCMHCEKSFPSQSYLRRHIKRVHIEFTENPKIFQCDLCQKSFKCLKSFKYHVLSHTGEKPYECSVCVKRFRSKGTLDLHKKTHTGTKDHVCNFCGDSFVQRSNMVRHVKKHHSAE